MNIPDHIQGVLFFAAGFLVAAGLVLLVRWGIYHWMGNVLFPRKEKSKFIPADAGLNFEDLFISKAGKHGLKAWYVNAGDESIHQKAVLIYPGRHQTMADWIPAMAYLWRRGISSMVFDYSGQGASSGRAGINNLFQDAQAAYLAFLDRIPPRARKYLIGYSLGVGPLLQAVTTVECEVDGVFFISPVISAREAVSCLQSFPKFLTALLPEVFNNLRQVKKLCVPLVLIHSIDDEVFPSEISERMYSAAREPKYLVLLHGLAHQDMFNGKEEQYLAPVADLINK
jgi:alpha-beta hydrolase superfamily lysophospholipase